MPQYLLSKAAQSDLEDIWEYSLATWGHAQAISYLQDLRDTCHALAEGHKTGRPVHIRTGYLKAKSGAHLIFFRHLDDNSIAIIRILHQSMDTDRHL